MPERRYFLRLGGAFFLGLFALAVAFIIFVFLLPYILLIAMGTLIIAAVFIAIWAIVYVAMVVGVAIYYFVRHPMKWEKEDKGYAIEKAKEAGRREKGKSRQSSR
jgi:membrane protein implicated in regulation of membrane protease activity